MPQKPTTATVAIIDDLTGLGGPMGSETTTEITRQHFTGSEQKAKAMARVENWIRRNRKSFYSMEPNFSRMSYATKLRRLSDAGSFGVTIETIQLH